MSQKSLEHISNKTVVILGDFLHEGVVTAITTLGYKYLTKKLYDLTPKTFNPCQGKTRNPSDRSEFRLQ